MSRLVIIGAGAWGTALALQAVRAGNDVSLVARDAATASTIAANRESNRLPAHRLPDAVDVRHDIPAGADLLLWVVPVQHLRSSFLRLQPAVGSIVVGAKGVEAGTYLLPLEIVNEVSPGGPVAILTGPNFAHEVASGFPAAAVVASTDADLRERVRLMLGTNTFRLYGNDDPIGAQLGGAAKNVIAIAAGAVIGAGLGENARAALVTRGLSELRRLAIALGGRAETVMGLSGLGDLLLTCTGASSRNFSLGHALGRGESLSDILARRSEVTEGVPTAAALVARGEGVELPICRAVADLLAGAKTLDQAIAQLLLRPQRDE
ncbi:MAG: glycerol-3-phosphate dehydrogenase [Acetobacteraceae bacterium]|jgi:glycerol-3-phosphate dehydrogenase (NAD(P)+)|nr:NAD(P)-dependent glycerol-3-phosphate dehydrogenase [Rhodopila sp.]MEA2727483.1 glycerol-3-phosphate dehydrogenase [Acetobacteraceae bacterium]MEA2773289.1 glycerol-3-phosphate dehydrogenase [Acetobacteraceae bacterium]